MSLKQTTPTKVKINGTNFYITPFPALKAANMTGELASTLAPLLSVLTAGIAQAGDVNSLLDMDASKAAQMVLGCSALDGSKIESLADKLLAHGNVAAELEDEDGNIERTRLDRDTVDEIFCGSVEDMFVLCFHVIKVNFSGFFEKMSARSGGANAQEEETENTEKTPRPIL